MASDYERVVLVAEGLLQGPGSIIEEKLTWMQSYKKNEIGGMVRWTRQKYP
jgi:hypothetical protein